LLAVTVHLHSWGGAGEGTSVEHKHPLEDTFPSKNMTKQIIEKEIIKHLC